MLQVVNFDGSLSTPGSGRTIVRYNWDFGDGVAKTVSQAYRNVLGHGAESIYINTPRQLTVKQLHIHVPSGATLETDEERKAFHNKVGAALTKLLGPAGQPPVLQDAFVQPTANKSYWGLFTSRKSCEKPADINSARRNPDNRPE